MRTGMTDLSSFQQLQIDGWTVTLIDSIEGVESIRPVWVRLHSADLYPVVNADIDRYLSIVRSRRDSRAYVLLFEPQSSCGSGPFVVAGRLEDTRFLARLGYCTLWRPRLHCLHIVYGGVLGSVGEREATALVRALLILLGQGEIDVVCFNHLRSDSAVAKCAARQPGTLRRTHVMQIEPHWRLRIPRDLDGFFQQCSKNERKHFRRYLKRIETDYPGDVAYAVYSRRDEVDQAVKDISAISGSTYQSALGVGVVDGPEFRSRLLASAEHGWFRCHILYVRDKPVAYRLALKYGRIYFGDGIGYDPDWRDYNVGTISLLKTIEELGAQGDVDYYDFGFGDADWKRMSGAEQWSEIASLCIFATRPIPCCINMLYTATTWLSGAAEWLAKNTIGVNRVKRKWRDRLSRPTGPTSENSGVARSTPVDASPHARSAVDDHGGGAPANRSSSQSESRSHK